MITALYASLCALLFILLTIRIGVYRVMHKIDFGTGDDMILTRRIRAHANFSEYVPLTLLLLLLIEVQGANILMLHCAGILLLNARLFHAYGLSENVLPLRLVGQMLMLLTLVFLIGLNGFLYFHG